MIVSVAQTAGVLFFCSLAGFIFAKRHFPGRDWLFIFVLITAAMPSGQTTIIPFYLLMVKFNWIDTFWPLIIPWWAPPLSIFLMRQYIANGIPDELIDASHLDGSGLFGTYWRIVAAAVGAGAGRGRHHAVRRHLERLPLQPAGAEVGRHAHRHLAIAELSQRTQAATLYGPLFAGIVVVTMPPIILYFIFQRRLTGHSVGLDAGIGGSDASPARHALGVGASGDRAPADHAVTVSRVEQEAPTSGSKLNSVA